MINKDKLKGFVTGVIITSLVGSSAVLASPIEKQISVIYDNLKVYVNGKIADTKDANGNVVEPFTYNGTTYLPVRAVGQALGKTVKWDEATNSVYISDRLLEDSDIKISQNDKVYDISKQNENITLDKNKFSISFKVRKYDSVNKKFYSACIAAVPDEKLFNKELINTHRDYSLIFNKGGARAWYINREYDTLCIGQIGYHSIFYENENSRRASLVKENEDGSVNLSWTIDSITLFDDNKQKYSMSEIPLTNIYLIIFIDSNLNNIIEDGELAKINISLNNNK